jgi:hypothetical protein
VHNAEKERLARDNIVANLQLQVLDLQQQVLGLEAQAGPAN